MKNYLSKGIKFLKDKDYRFDILSNFGFYNSMDDNEYLKKKYKSRTYNDLNLNNPITFNEKLQWLKLNDRNPKYTDMVDKYEVKRYVSNLIGDEYIIPTLGVFDKFDDIDFNKLPNQFVIKCTHDSGGIIVVKNKNSFNIKDAKKKINKFLKRNFYYYGREWPYKNVKPRIIVEKFMEDKIQKDILDYKFFCFDGKVEYMYISAGSHSKNQRLQYFNKNFEPVDCKRSDYQAFDILPKKPKGYAKMVELAEKLSSNIKHVRVDFYEINEQIYFGEFTFYTGSGFIPFEDEYWDRKLGNLIKI